MFNEQFAEIGLWTSIAEGRDCIGAFLNRGELGIEAFDANDILLGVFKDEDAAANAISDCWDAKFRINGGNRHAEDPAGEFLESVVPWTADGYVTIHWKQEGGNFHGRSCQTITDALSLVAELRTTQADVYFCLSRQRFNSGKRSRAGATWLNSTWMDADVDPADPRAFPTIEEAVAGIILFCDRMGLPRPSIMVASGSGVHAYWLSDRMLSVEDWQPFADALKNAIQTAELKVKDVGVTGDAARVLRVPGTLNFKYDPPRPVRLLEQYSTFERHDFSNVFAGLLELAPAGKAARKQPGPHLGPLPDVFKKLLLLPALGEGIEELSPLPLAPIKAGCAWLCEAHDTGGKDFDQPQWNLTTLIATFLENGNELAHQFGNGHPEYEFEETEKLWDRKVREQREKNLGWPKCRTIQDHGSTHCKSCPHFAAGKSPLHLGLQQEPPHAAEIEGVTRADLRAARARFRDSDKNGKPKASLANAVIAIRGLRIGVRLDLFHHGIDVTYKGDAKTIHEGLLTDDTISAVRSLINNTYRIDCGDNYTLAAIKEVARDNAFDPVLDMLDNFQAKWDGTKRLDTWVIDYLGAEDTPLYRAIGRLALIAACRRGRVPGCKFDSITVLEGVEGTNKSTAIRILAGDENFSDQSILGASDKEVQEQLDGTWMHENADLAGMRKADVEQVKAFASRQVDRARPAYGRVREDRPRRSIEWGTTNNKEYLLGQTGNRRFWPLATGKIDIEALIRDREQLLGEAATYEAAGMSIVLDEKLWGAARDAQEQRRVADPWEDILVNMPAKVIHKSADGFERVASATVLLVVLNIPASQQTSAHGQRLALAMQHLGWERNSSGRVTINGKSERGYIRRSPPPTSVAELKAIKAEIAAEAVARTSAQVQDLLNEWSTDHEVKARVDAMLKEMGADTEAEATLLAKVAERFSRKRSDSSD